jgi:hypothetical protein
MHKGKLIGALVAFTGAVAVAVACGGGSDGANGTNGEAGAAGQQGSKGDPGGSASAGMTGMTGPQGPAGEAGTPGPIIVVSESAKRGLDISPVAVNLNGLTGAQIEQVGQGSYLVNAVIGCSDCHNSPAGGFLAGGNQFGPVQSRNLTPDATTGLKLTEAQFIQVMRTGADFQHGDAGTQATASKTLIVMPWVVFRWMSLEDIKSIYAYLKVIPGVTNAVAPDTIGGAPPGAAPFKYTDGEVDRDLPAELDAMGNPIPDPNNVSRGLAIVPLNTTFTPPVGDTTALAQYGRGSYLVNAASSCNDCHSNPARANNKVNFAAYLSGGQIFAVPPPLNALTHQSRSMSQNLIGAGGFFAAPSPADLPTFLQTITQGVHADEETDGGPKTPLGFPMPAAHYKNMTVTDLTAIYTYLSVVATNDPRPGKATQDPTRYCTKQADCTGAGELCGVGDGGASVNECYHGACTSDLDCGACQVCDVGVTNTCLMADPTSTCVTKGL